MIDWSRLPVLGPFLQELLTPERVAYRRHGDREDRGRRLVAHALVFLTTLCGARYLTWVITVVDWNHPVVATTFVGAEIVCFALFLLASVGAWRLRFKPEARPTTVGSEAVDVFITVCGEPEEVIHRTVQAASAITWSGRLTVYVLDDGGSDAVEAIARRFRAVYLSRPKQNIERTDAKAGNLNFGLAHSSGDYVLTLDADQVPVPQIIERLSAYIHLPNVAFVQSKQSFLVPEDDPYYCQDLVFYNTLQPAFDSNDSVISCGSGVLYRRMALDDLGGFSTWNLVEDLTTSYELHCRGWKSLYYPYQLSAGLAPENLEAVYRQRGQWALDTMRLFLWRNPLFARTLPWPIRINYFVIGFSYITAGFVAPIFYFIPIWSYATGAAVLTGWELDFALYRTAYFLSMTLAMRWLFRGHQPGKQFQMLVGLFPVYCANTLRALRYRRRKPVYKVNNVGHRRRLHPIVGLMPQLSLLLGNALGPFYAVAVGTATPRLILANVVVSAIAIWSLSQVCAAALTRHSWESERNPLQVYAPVTDI